MFVKITIDGKPLDGFTVKRGDDYDVNIIIYDPAQTGATLRFVAKKSIDDLDDDAIISKAPSDIPVTVTGNVLSASFAISGAETKALDGGLELIYGFQRRLNSKTQTLEEGSFSIEADVVRNDS